MKSSIDTIGYQIGDLLAYSALLQPTTLRSLFVMGYGSEIRIDIQHRYKIFSEHVICRMQRQNSHSCKHVVAVKWLMRAVPCSILICVL